MFSEETITRDILKLSGRMATDSDEGVEMKDGQSAREYVAEMNQEMFEEAAGEQFDDPTMAELQDAILYSLFPNLPSLDRLRRQHRLSLFTQWKRP
jgi:hypothetical protein